MNSNGIAVIGLGAIGGSLMRALAAHDVALCGYDVDPACVARAQSDGFAAQLWTGRLTDDCGTVVIAAPVRPSVTILAALARSGDYALVTDVGSTKRLINVAAEQHGLGHCFAGSHPLAGTQASGWHAGRADMFEGSRVFVCPTSESSERAMSAAVSLWQGVGGVVERISANEHDTRMAWASHLPQLTASALGLALRKAGLGRAQLGPGGYDMTRLAGSDPEIWTDIAATNADLLDAPLEELIRQLREMRRYLRSGNEIAIGRAQQMAQAWYAQDTQKR